MADREKTATVSAQAAQWPLDRLIDYIVGTHHQYVRSALPAIAKELDALQFTDRDSHPELARVAGVFDGMKRELERHLLKEEQILFPYVRQLAGLASRTRPDWASPFGTVANPIAMMEREHRDAFDALRQIRELTHDFAVPAGASIGYSACMTALAEFEADLERHVDLENTVLFPRTLALESGMADSI